MPCATTRIHRADMPRTPSSPSVATPARPASKRVRLSPQLRRQQILDAALIEFSSLGFAGASMSRIARRVGTSKSNIYVHFASKDAIFETLLQDLLAPSVILWLPERTDADLDEAIDNFIDQAYDRMTPKTIAAIRLLLSEGHRLPDLVERWYDSNVLPMRAEQTRRVQRHTAAGNMRGKPLGDYYCLAMAPILYAAASQMVFKPERAKEDLAAIRSAHRDMLRMLLRPDRDAERQETPA